MKTERVRYSETEDLPVLMSAKEFNKAVLQISEVKLYAMLNIPGAPVLHIGRKLLVNTRKFIAWLEDQAG